MVSRNKRIVAAFAAVAAMGMGLAGCGSDTAGDTKTTDDGGVVNITYMHRLPDSEGMTLVNDIVAKWNKQHPDIQVKATKFDGKASDMIKKLETDVKSGEAPDLAQVGYAELPEVFTKGLLQDVTQYAEQYKNDFASGPYSLVQVGGKAYGLPQDTGPLVYFYNKAEFEKLGITDTAAFVESVKRYNECVAAGKDLDFGKEAKWLTAIDTPPFYGIHRHVRVSAVVSGVNVGPNMEVLAVETGEPIPGLFAVGNTAGNFYGGVDYSMYMPGLSLGRAHTQGYVTGKYVASL